MITHKKSLEMGERFKNKMFVFSYTTADGFFERTVQIIGKIGKWALSSLWGGGDAFFGIMNLNILTPLLLKVTIHLVWNTRQGWVCRPFITMPKNGLNSEEFADHHGYWGQLIIGEEKFGNDFINYTPEEAFDVINPHIKE